MFPSAYRAARKERIPLHYLAAASPPVPHAGGREPEAEHDVRDSRASASVSRITETVAPQEENARPIPRAERLRGHKVAKDQYVTLTSQELSGLRPPTSTQMEIVRSVRLDEIDPVYLETSYYDVPDRGGERRVLAAVFSFAGNALRSFGDSHDAWMRARRHRPSRRHRGPSRTSWRLCAEASLKPSRSVNPAGSLKLRASLASGLKRKGRCTSRSGDTQAFGRFSEEVHKRSGERAMIGENLQRAMVENYPRFDPACP